MFFWLTKFLIGWPNGHNCNHQWKVIDKVKREKFLDHDQYFFVLQCENCGDVKKRHVN